MTGGYPFGGREGGNLWGRGFRTVLAVVAVAGAYYVGTAVGLLAAFPASGPSILWPPNAILLAVLLLTPPRRWALYLLAAFPSHFLIEQQAGFPLALNVGLFATNCGQALLGAVAVRWAIGPRIDFDELRHVIFFIAGAAVVAPFVSSFFDVWLWVEMGWPAGIRYWPTWWVRFASNALTILVVTPALVIGIVKGRAWLRTPPPLARAVEAVVLGLGFAASGLFIGLAEPRRVPVLMYTPLPLLLWAAARFGSAGVGTSLLAMTLCMALAALRHPESFGGSPDAAQTFSAQFFMVMLVTATSLMFLAAVIRERGRAEAALRELLTFERLRSEVSAAFAARPGERVGEGIQEALGRMVEGLDADAATLTQVPDDGRPVHLEHASYRRGVGPVAGNVRTSEFPWCSQRVLGGNAVRLSRLEDLPGDATTDRDSFRRYELRSAAAIPLMGDGESVGILALAKVREGRPWSPETVERLRLLGEIVTAALLRHRADHRTREGEALNRAVLGSLSGAVAVVDREGVIVRVNEAWIQLSRGRSGILLPAFEMGGNYLEACRRDAEAGIVEAQAALEGLEAVLEGTRRGFSVEYAGPGSEQGIWWEMLVVQLDRPEGGAVITHRDVSDRKRTEHEAQEQRQGLAHAARVLAVGELAGSLAHELNQPLAAMVANAQAAQRLLGQSATEPGELREILSDIVQDGKRGAEVIRGVRALLRRSDPDRAVVDMNGLVLEVARLLRSEAILKRISVRLETSPDVLPVLGERVQLQQVILNLVMNAYEAVNDVADGPRELVVQTRDEAAGVQVFVSDSGPGLSDETMERMFQPFFTTKAGGLGLGLAISRTIVRAHGGEIRVARGVDRGSTISVTLPHPPAGHPACKKESGTG
jgi:signal transduction histidine kinase/integral membrane sensor domain MASE1